VNVDVTETVGDVEAIHNGDEREVLPHITFVAGFAGVVVGHVFFDLPSSPIQPSNEEGGWRQLLVSRPVRLRSRLGTAHHSRALLPPFGPGASPSASAIRLNSTMPGAGNWCWRQLPGNPGIGGRCHSQDWRQRGWQTVNLG